jgi:hypothetical protein
MASESEPNRKSDGKAVDKDGALVVTFDDDRTQHWTRCESLRRTFSVMRVEDTRQPRP